MSNTTSWFKTRSIQNTKTDVFATNMIVETFSLDHEPVTTNHKSVSAVLRCV